MRPNQACLTRFRKSMPSAEVVEEAEIEDEVEVVEAAAEEVKTRLKIKTILEPPDIRVPSTQTCQQESGKGALYISNTGGGLTFVQSQPPALGRTCTSPSRSNETGTSPLTTN